MIARVRSLVDRAWSHAAVRNGMWRSYLCVVRSGDGELPCLGAEWRRISSPVGLVDSLLTEAVADPFLLVIGDDLYVFVEVKRFGEDGRIDVFHTRDLERFDRIQDVLPVDYHVSYPMVFRSGKAIYLIPETSSAGEVSLYKYDSFPGPRRKVRTLLTGSYVDTTVLEHDGRVWLFTTSDAGLELFYTDDIEHGALTPHPMNPICAEPTLSRSGGSIWLRRGTLLRPAQDGRDGYGSNLRLMRIERLDTECYSEREVVGSFFDQRQPMLRLGGHHLSACTYRGLEIIAFDRRVKERGAFRLLRYLMKLPARMAREGSSGGRRSPKAAVHASAPPHLDVEFAPTRAALMRTDQQTSG